jgi:hypothetical protein
MENPPLRVFSLPFAAMTLFRFYGYYLSQKAPPSSIEDRGIFIKRMKFAAILVTAKCLFLHLQLCLLRLPI